MPEFLRQSGYRLLALVPLFSNLLIASVGLAADSAAPLAEAAKTRNRMVVRQLLNQGVDVDAAQVDGMTALHWAVYWNDAATTRLIVDAGANVKAENRYGVTPLALACTNGSTLIVKRLLAAGADSNASLRGGETPLMTAARTGTLAPVLALLASGADVNAKERRGQTAVMWAAAEGHTAVVRALIEAGADFRSPLKSGFTPLFFATREGRTDVVLALLEFGLDVNSVMQPERTSSKGPRKGTSPLILAVENGHFELAEVLLRAGADPNDQRCGFAPLHALTWVRKPIRGDGDPPPIGSGTLGSLEFARRLVALGANVNVRHKKRRTSGSRLDRTDATPFLLAAETGDLPLLKVLLELGADPRLTNVDRCTPLLAAAGVGVLGNGEEAAGTETEAIETIQLMLEHGADINVVDANGETAMHGAAYKGRTQMVRFLAKHGADVQVWNQKNKNGWTPLMIVQGHRPGNFRPSPDAIVVVSQLMQAAGLEVPPAPIR